MKITIEFDDLKSDLKAECFEAIRILAVAKTTIFRELSRPARVGSPDVICSWVKEIDGDSAIRNVCVFEINL
jgi:hypothetical protein